MKKQLDAELQVRRQVAELRARSFQLADEVQARAKISAGTLPNLVARLELEQLSLEMERIGLNARIKAIGEALKEKSTSSELGMEHRFDVRMKQAELDLVKSQYDKLRSSLEGTKDESQLAELEARLNMAQLRAEEAQLRAVHHQRATGSAPAKRELSEELRRSAIELRVVEAKLNFIADRLATLHDAGKVASELNHVKAELEHQQVRERKEADLVQNRLQVLKQRIREAENERERLMDLRSAFEKQLADSEQAALER